MEEKDMEPHGHNNFGNANDIDHTRVVTHHVVGVYHCRTILPGHER